MKVKGNGEKCEIGESWWNCEMGTDVSCTSQKSKCYDILEVESAAATNSE